jgi:hypothetical protein
MVAVETIDRHEHEDRHGDGEHLDPILHRLHERDALHAAERDVERDDRADEHDARPVGQAGEDVGERDARALHLRHGVEEPDEQHEADGDLAEERRVEPALGEIGNRVGAEATQRPGDEEQQEQITAGVTHRIPQRVVADDITMPATPMKEAAERYSPEMAEAFQPTDTERPATKKSLAVLEVFAERKPIQMVTDDGDGGEGEDPGIDAADEARGRFMSGLPSHV